MPTLLRESRPNVLIPSRAYCRYKFSSQSCEKHKRCQPENPRLPPLVSSTQPANQQSLSHVVKNPWGKCKRPFAATQNDVASDKNRDSGSPAEDDAWFGILIFAHFPDARVEANCLLSGALNPMFAESQTSACVQEFAKPPSQFLNAGKQITRTQCKTRR